MNRSSPNRILAAASLVLAVAGLGLFIAGLDDGLHLFADQRGERQVVLTTAFDSHLLPSLALAALLIGGCWLACSLAASRLTGRSIKETAALDALTYMPLVVLLVVPLRYVPGIARSSSFAFLLSSTHSTALLFVAAVLTIILKFALLPSRSEKTGGPSRRRLSDRAVGWIVFAVAMAALAVAIPLFSAGWSFGGDEPHYLIIAHSIAEDGDIYIEDDHESGVWRQFTSHNIHPQYFRRDREGRIVPFHKIGLPLLAALPYRLAGRLGAVLLIGLLAALCAANIYWLTLKLVPDRRAALLATTWTALTLPSLPMSFLFFSEMPTAAFTLVALNLIIQRDGAPPRFPWAIPFLIWFLPWFHARGLVTSAVLTVLLLVRLRGRTRLAAGIGALCILLALTLPAWNWGLYGDFSPVAEMGLDQGAAFRLENIILGIGGLLFDQEFGMLLYNPVIILAAIGCLSLWRRSRSALVWVVLIIGSCVGPSVLYRMWWGGGSPPGRYYAAIIHLAAIPLAAILAGRKGRCWRLAFFVAGSIAMAIGITLMVHSNLLVNGREEPAAALMLTAVSAGLFDAVEWWPSWFGDSARAWPLTGLLLIAAAVVTLAIVMLLRFARRRGAPHILAAAATGSLVLFLGFAGTYTWLAEKITPGEPNGFAPRSRESDLLYQQRYRHQSHRIVDLGGTLRAGSLPSRGFSAEFLYSAAGLSADSLAPRRRSLPIAPGEFEITLDPPAPFWAGRYQLELGLRAEGTETVAQVSVFDLSGSGARSRLPASRREFTLSGEFREIRLPLILPRNSDAILIEIAAARPLRFTHAMLIPDSLDRIGSWELPQELFDLVAWRFEDYILFTGTEMIYRPRGEFFWTRGGSIAVWTVASREPFSAVSLEIRGRPGISAELRSGRSEEVVRFSHSKRRAAVELPLQTRSAGGYYLAELQVTTRGAFVPAERLAESRDRRRLGLFVRIALTK